MKKLVKTVLIVVLLVSFAASVLAIEYTPIISTPAGPTYLGIPFMSHPGSRTVDLVWKDNSTNETGFKLERKPASSPTWILIAVLPANTVKYKNTGLNPYADYKYRIRAYNSAGNSSYSNEFTIKTDSELVILQPNGGEILSGVSTYTIKWSVIGDHSGPLGSDAGIMLYYSVNGGAYEIINHTSVATGAGSYVWTVPNLFSDNVKINAMFYHGFPGGTYVSDESNADFKIHPILFFNPVPPSHLTAAAITYARVDLAWDHCGNDVKGYKIERMKEGGSYQQIAAFEEDKWTYSDTGASPDTKYYYRIRAYNVFGNSSYSNIATVTTPKLQIVLPGLELLTSPKAPTGLAAVPVSTSSIKLSWTDNSDNEAGFKIERKKEGGIYDEITITGANIKEFTDTGLSSNTKYYYRVRASNSKGNSAFSNEASVTTLIHIVPLLPKINIGILIPPVAPASLTAEALSRSEIALKWNDNSNNESGFVIERGKKGGAYTAITITANNVTKYMDSGLDPSTGYLYRIKAYNAVGESGFSNVVSAETLPSETEPEKIIKLYIDNTNYNVNGTGMPPMDAAPEIRDDRTFLPIRYVTDALGAVIAWDGVENKVTITMGGKIIELWIGKSSARVNGEYSFIDPTNENVKPFLVPPGRTMLPVRFITEKLGCKVDWNAALQEVTITYLKP